jgi:hypothetical protein
MVSLMRTRTKKEPRRKPRLFLDSKVERVMTKLGWDFERFQRAYDEDPGLRGRRTQVPSREQVQAVEQFLKTGDFTVLKEALATQNIQTANAAVARVIAYKARQQKGARE